MSPEAIKAIEIGLSALSLITVGLICFARRGRGQGVEVLHNRSAKPASTLGRSQVDHRDNRPITYNVRSGDGRHTPRNRK